MAIRDRSERARRLPADIFARLDHVPDLCRRRGVRLAYLFGSLARPGQPVAPGDVDLAVLGGPETDLWALRLELGEALGTDRVDVLDLGRTSEVTRFEVLRTARLIYKLDDDTENRFELRSIAEYKDRAVPRKIRARWLQEALPR